MEKKEERNKKSKPILAILSDFGLWHLCSTYTGFQCYKSNYYNYKGVYYNSVGIYTLQPYAVYLLFTICSRIYILLMIYAYTKRGTDYYINVYPLSESSMRSYGRALPPRKRGLDISFSSDSEDNDRDVSRASNRANSITRSSQTAIDSSPLKADISKKRQSLSKESELGSDRVSKVSELEAWDDLFEDIDNSTVPERPQLDAKQDSESNDSSDTAEISNDSDNHSDEDYEQRADNRVGFISRVNINSILLSFASTENASGDSQNQDSSLIIESPVAPKIASVLPFAAKPGIVRYGVTRTYKLEHDDDEQECQSAKIFMFEPLSPARKRRKNIKYTSFHLNDYKANEDNNNRKEATEFILAGLVFHNNKDVINCNSILILTLIDIVNGCQFDHPYPYDFLPVVEGLDLLMGKLASCKSEDIDFLRWLASSTSFILVTISVERYNYKLEYEIANVDLLFEFLNIECDIPSGILRIAMKQLDCVHKLRKLDPENIEVRLLPLLKNQLYFTTSSGMQHLISLYWKANSEQGMCRVLECIANYIESEYEFEDVQCFQAILSRELKHLKHKTPTYDSTLVFKIAVLISTRYEILLNEFASSEIITNMFLLVNKYLKVADLVNPDVANSVIFLLGFLLNVVANRKVSLRKEDIMANVRAVSLFAANTSNSETQRHLLGYDVMLLGYLRLVVSYDVDILFLTSQLSAFKADVQSPLTLGLSLKIEKVLSGLMLIM